MHPPWLARLWCVTSLVALVAAQTVFNARDFGAAGDGTTDDTAAIAKLWRACAAASPAPATVVFPTGTYLTGPFNVSCSNVAVVFAGNLRAISNRALDPTVWPVRPRLC